jgi:hypothetical protein
MTYPLARGNEENYRISCLTYTIEIVGPMGIR